MLNTITIALFVIFVLVSSLLSSIDFNNYLFIHALTYIQLAFSIGFTLLLVNFTFIARNKKNIPVKFNLVDLFILVFGGYLIIRYAFSPRFNTMPDVILFTVMLSIIYFSVKNIAGNNKERVVKIVLYLIIFIGIFQTVYGVLQLAGILPNLFHYKFRGSFGNLGDLANFLVIPYTLLLSLFFQETKRRNCKSSKCQGQKFMYLLKWYYF